MIKNALTLLGFSVALLALAPGVHAADAIPSERDPGITPPRGLANYNTVTPDDYPRWASVFEQQGRTYLRLVVREDGTVGVVEVIQSSGSSRLDTAAVEIAQRRFRYTPATKDGRPIAVWHTMVVDWTLLGISREAELFNDYYGTPVTGALPSGTWRPDADNRITTADYPRTFRQTNDRTTVRLRVQLREDGSVESAKVTGSSGDVLLDGAARRMVERRFHYPPVMTDGKPLAGSISTSVTYSPRDRPYPFPLPPICRDAPVVTPPARLADDAGRPIVPTQFMLNEDGSLGAALQWNINQWRPVNWATKGFNEDHRFLPPRHDGVAAKCWFDLEVPRSGSLEQAQLPISTQSALTPPVPQNSHVVLAEDYPAVSLRKREQGDIKVRYLVREDGTVGGVAILGSSGSRDLDEAAIRVVMRWVFKPGTDVSGKPVPVWLVAIIAFHLN